MVFQQYALFPHMSIYDNVAFGLKVKRVPRARARRRVCSEMLRVVELEGSSAAEPAAALRRSATARARWRGRSSTSPAALLLDEPLGALDVKLRKQMQLELKRIQNDLGTTFVYVTHDQEEALAMSDRIAVMNGGHVEQIGSPREIYERPQTVASSADFIGSLNALDLRIDELVGVNAVMRLGEARARSSCPSAPAIRQGDSVRVAVRPERVQIEPAGSPLLNGGSRLEGTIAEIVFLGMYTQFHVDTQAGRLVSHRLADESLRGLEGRLARRPLLGRRAGVLARRLQRSSAGSSSAAKPPLGEALRPTSAPTTTTSESDDRRRRRRRSPAGAGSGSGAPSRGRSGTSTRVPTTNEATAYSSNEVVNAIRNDETIAGKISGSVIERNVRRRLAPRS